MFTNYLKITFRNLIRHKTFSLINIFGLSVGIACTILLLMWIRSEIYYDRFHENFNEIHRVVTDYGGSRVPTSPGPMAATLNAEIPDVINATRFKGDRAILKYGDRSVRIEGLNAEPSFFDIFSFPIIEGDPRAALDDVSSIVLTESSAQRLFGDEEAIGKVVKLNNKWTAKIGGIIADVPANSSPPLQFEYLAPFKVYYFWRDPDNWTKHGDYQTWVQLNANSNVDEVNQKIDALFRPYLPDSKLHYLLQPLREIHLRANTTRWDGPHGDIKYVILFSALAVLMIIIACINYTNMATARSLSRSKEIGIRKVVGASRNQLIKQHFSESYLMVLLSIIVGILLVELGLPIFNRITGSGFYISFTDSWFVIGILLLFLITGFLAGLYPALILSSLGIVNNLKNSSIYRTRSSSGFSFRKYLVIAQFTITIIVIISTIIIYQQLSFIRNKHLGYNPENLMYLNLSDNYPESAYTTLKSELLNIPAVSSLGGSTQIPTGTDFISNVTWHRNEQEMSQSMIIFEVDEDFIDTYGIEIVNGSKFRKAPDDWSNCSFIVNEKAAQIMGFDNPTGEPISAYEWKGKIIGVVKDFHFENLREKIKPMVFVYRPINSLLTVRINSDNMSDTIKKIEKLVKKHYPGIPIEYHFIDQDLEVLYRKEMQMGNIFSAFTLITILISSLGLYGLISFVVEQKTKEIGVRKVLGSSVFGIVRQLSLPLIKWIIIANLIAWPIAWIVMDKWLRNFAYQSGINLLVFLLAGVIALLITIITISWQTVRAATANPVKSLRYE